MSNGEKTDRIVARFRVHGGHVRVIVLFSGVDGNINLLPAIPEQ